MTYIQKALSSYFLLCNAGSNLTSTLTLELGAILKKIKKKFCKINLRKFSFTNRIVDLWNTLPQSAIDAKYVRQFEIRLDKYWEHQDVKFEYKASIQNEENTGNHTEISCITEEVEVDIVAESQRLQMT